jgi:carbamoyl-phosphate synthase small subunit
MADAKQQHTGVLALADGSVFRGIGFGAIGAIAGELCFNTAMTGYQEILTDPSYADQIIAFTFPHIGNVGTNVADLEAASPYAKGLVVREAPTAPSSWRSECDLPAWLAQNGLIGVGGVDTRAATRRIRDLGMPHAVVAHDPKGVFDLDALVAKARAFVSLEGRDLAKNVTTHQRFDWNARRWQWPEGFSQPSDHKRKVVAIDFGAKRNILRCLVETGSSVVVLPADATIDDILSHAPDGVFLSNGPGDPAATGTYALPTIRALLERRIPIFGICLGHQLLALALGGQTVKMKAGHHGANHPVKDHETAKVAVTSMNHGFAVDASTLPQNVVETHMSLFDGSNCGLKCRDRPAFSVQYHPEASPGPMDSHYLFDRFGEMIDANKATANG